MQAYSKYKPLAIDAVPQWDLATDVAVIGFGATGVCAAIEAAGSGARVMLFERSSGSGGASGLSGGEIYIGGGTDAQIAAGFTDTVEDFTAYLKLASGPCVDEDKCELYGREALNHYQWLKDQGVPYRGNYLPGKVIEPDDDSTLIWSGSETAAPFRDKAKPAPRGHVIQYRGTGGGRLLIDILESRARDLGTEIHLDARAVALITDNDRVAGVVVRIDNKDRFVRAEKGVVLATGGFAFNESMRRKYCPDSLRANTPIGDQDDGVGIELGVSVGGDAIHMDQFFTTCPWTIPPEQAHGVFVNVTGQRFVNEDCYHGVVSRFAIDQPGDKVFLLLDNAHFSQPLDMAGIAIAGVGDTWEEVETDLEMPAGTLSATMAFYNDHARQGRDPLFDKKPPILIPLDHGPLVALELNFETSFFTFFTLGGLKTSTDGQVLNRAGMPIPGLFAAGRCTSGLPAWGHGYSSGMSLADCTFFGRQAGRKAAR
jgi:3-oxo-5alpha-steroid 4-dehydrogenase